MKGKGAKGRNWQRRMGMKGDREEKRVKDDGKAQGHQFIS